MTVTRTEAPIHFVRSADVFVRIPLPYTAPPAALVANARPHWSHRHRDTRQVRQDVTMLGKAAGLHRLAKPVAHVTVVLVWAPGDRRRRDPINLAPLVKACCDGLARGRKDLIGLDLVPDDTPEWMDQRTAVIAPPPAKGMWLDLSIRFEEVVA